MAESSNVAKLQKSSTSLGECSKEDLLQKLKDYRKANMELLEDKRHLLLRSQEAFKAELQLERTQSEVMELKRRLQDVERAHTAKCDDATTQTIKELVRQLSNNSKQASEDLDATNPFVRRSPAGLSNTEENVALNFAGSCSNIGESIAKLPQSRGECRCGAAIKLEEVMRINHLWQKDYTSLLDEYNRVRSQMCKLENELRVADLDRTDMARKLGRLYDRERLALNSVTTPVQFLNSRLSGDTSVPSADDIEALKYQLVVYKEDFESEKQEKQRLSTDVSQLKMELQKSFAVIEDLNSEKMTIKESLRRVSSEKQHIISELRRLSTTSVLPFSTVAHVDHRSRVADPERTRSEDVIPHSLWLPNRSRTDSDPRLVRMPYDAFFGGDVVRDGIVDVREPALTPAAEAVVSSVQDAPCLDAVAGDDAKNLSPRQ